MTEKEMQLFKELFSKYCRQEINRGLCTEDTCFLCPINAAYEKIFKKAIDDSEED